MQTDKQIIPPSQSRMSRTRKSQSISQLPFVIMNKVTPFKKNFADTKFDHEKKNITTRLADNIYSRNLIKNSNVKNTNPQDQQIVPPRPSTANLIDNLNHKTLKVSQYNQIITTMMKQKTQLSTNIQTLKKKICQQKKIIYQSSISSAKLENQMRIISDSNSKMKVESNRTQGSLNILLQQCKQLKNEIQNIDVKSKETSNKISSQKPLIQQAEQKIRTTRPKLLKQQKQLNEIKSNLTIILKTLNISSTHIKQLQNEKAEMLLNVNQQFQEHWKLPS